MLVGGFVLFGAMWMFSQLDGPSSERPQSVKLTQTAEDGTTLDRPLGEMDNGDVVTVRSNKQSIVDCCDDEIVLAEYYCSINANTDRSCYTSDEMQHDAKIIA